MRQERERGKKLISQEKIPYSPLPKVGMTKKSFDAIHRKLYCVAVRTEGEREREKESDREYSLLNARNCGETIFRLVLFQRVKRRRKEKHTLNIPEENEEGTSCAHSIRVSGEKLKNNLQPCGKLLQKSFHVYIYIYIYILLFLFW